MRERQSRKELSRVEVRKKNHTKMVQDRKPDKRQEVEDMLGQEPDRRELSRLEQDRKLEQGKLQERKDRKEQDS